MLGIVPNRGALVMFVGSDNSGSTTMDMEASGQLVKGAIYSVHSAHADRDDSVYIILNIDIRRRILNGKAFDLVRDS